VTAVSAGRALFLDWGGTLVRTVENRTVIGADGHPVLMPNVLDTLASRRGDFDRFFIASNQGRIARGEISGAEVRRRFAWLNDRLGGLFTDWRLCPHGDGDGCDCRKPAPGMFLDLARAWTIDLAASTHVGDSPKDREAARAAGVGRFVWANEFFRW
jgi:histidinol-phosphate phosphatase family protein